MERLKDALREAYRQHSRPTSRIIAFPLADLLTNMGEDPSSPQWAPFRNWRVINEKAGPETDTGKLKRDHKVDTIFFYRPPLRRDGPNWVGLIVHGEEVFLNLDKIKVN